MYTGLPFTSLGSGDEQEKPALIDRTGLDRELRGPGPRRSWIEPRWEMPQPAAPQQVNSNPLDILTRQNKAALDEMRAQIQGKRDALNQSIQPDRESAYRDYLIDFDVLNKSNMDAEQKQQQADRLYASYQKKAYGVHDKIKEQLKSLDQAEQQAVTKAAFDHLGKQIEIQSYQKLIDAGKLTPEDGLAMQYKTLGMAMPEGMVQRGAEMTPERAQQEYTRYKSMFDTLRGERLNYRRKPTGKDKGIWQEFDQDTKTWGDAPTEDQAGLDLLDSKVQSLAPLVDTWFERATGIKRPRLNSAVMTTNAISPLGQTVRQGLLQRWSEALGRASGMQIPTESPTLAPARQAVGGIVVKGGRQYRIVGRDADGEPLVEQVQ